MTDAESSTNTLNKNFTVVWLIEKKKKIKLLSLQAKISEMPFDQWVFRDGKHTQTDTQTEIADSRLNWPLGQFSVNNNQTTKPI